MMKKGVLYSLGSATYLANGVFSINVSIKDEIKTCITFKIGKNRWLNKPLISGRALLSYRFKITILQF